MRSASRELSSHERRALKAQRSHSKRIGDLGVDQSFTGYELISQFLIEHTRVRYLQILGPYACTLFLLRLALFAWIFCIARSFTWAGEGAGSGAITSQATVEMQTYLTELLVKDEFDGHHNTFRSIETAAEWWTYVETIVAPSLPLAKDKFFDQRNYLVDITVRTLRAKNDGDEFYGSDFSANNQAVEEWTACQGIERLRSLTKYSLQGNDNYFKNFGCEYKANIEGGVGSISGKYADYPATGYVMRMSSDNETLFATQLALMKFNDEEWLFADGQAHSTIDIDTRAFIVEFTIISPSKEHHSIQAISNWESDDLVSRGWLMFEQSARLKVHTTYSLETVPLQPFSLKAMSRNTLKNSSGMLFFISLIVCGVAMFVVEVLWWIELCRKRAYDPQYCGWVVDLLLFPLELHACCVSRKRARAAAAAAAAVAKEERGEDDDFASSAALPKDDTVDVELIEIDTTKISSQGKEMPRREGDATAIAPAFAAMAAEFIARGAHTDRTDGGSDARAGAAEAEGEDDGDGNSVRIGGDGAVADSSTLPATAENENENGRRWTKVQACHMELRYLRSMITRDIAAEHHGHSFGGTVLATPLLLLMMLIFTIESNKMTSPGQNPDGTDLFGADLYDANSAWDATLTDYIVQYSSCLRWLTALNVAMWVTMLCHIVAVFPAFRMVSQTFWSKFKEIMISIIYIIGITVAFMEFFRTEYGSFSENFATFQYSAITFLKALMGDFDFEITASSQHDVAAPLIMGSYVIICVYFLLSIFVAILSDSFVVVSGQSHRQSKLSDAEAKRRVSARAVNDVHRSIFTSIRGTVQKFGQNISSWSEFKVRVDALTGLVAKRREHGLRQAFATLRTFRREDLMDQLDDASDASDASAGGDAQLSSSHVILAADVARLHTRLDALIELISNPTIATVARPGPPRRLPPY